MLETLRADYVRTARAKGLRGKRILFQHVLRNSLVPVLSAIGPLIGALVTTLFAVEVVFGIPASRGTTSRRRPRATTRCCWG